MAKSGDATGAAPAKASSVKKTVLEFLIVTLIAGGVGATVLGPRGQKDKEPKKAEETAEQSHGSTKSNLFDLPPVVTNLGSPTEVWIRFEGAAVMDPNSTPHPEAILAEVAGDVMAYLRTATLSQLEGPVGLQYLRQELNEKAALRSQGKISEILIRTLVVQ